MLYMKLQTCWWFEIYISIHSMKDLGHPTVINMRTKRRMVVVFKTPESVTSIVHAHSMVSFSMVRVF